MRAAAGGTDDILAQAVGEFIDRLKPELACTPEGRDVDEDILHGRVIIEARRLSAGFMCADSRLGDRELLAFRRSFGAFEPEVLNGPIIAMRTSDVLTRDHDFIRTPSDMFLRLIDCDRHESTTRAWSYYEAALGIGHAVVALSDEPVRDSLVALDNFRTMLLDTLRHHDVDGDRPELEGLPGEPPMVAPTLDALLDELDALIGLESVKHEVKLIVNLTRVEKMRRAHGLPVPDRSRHLVFSGNPGTGKTTVARLLSNIYGVLGVLKKGHLVETDRGGLVSGYVGQTAAKVTEVVQSALDGTLFIDEAYALTVQSKEDFGAEAVATLLKLMEDDRERLIVVAAGYTEPMREFVGSNPGLQSRFPKTITFSDYTTDQLVEMFRGLGEDSEYHADGAVLHQARAYIDAQQRGPAFGNGRLVRNLFEAAVARHATRIAEIDEPTLEQLSTLTAADIPDAGELG
jgi:hypothetical protein